MAAESTIPACRRMGFEKSAALFAFTEIHVTAGFDRRAARAACGDRSDGPRAPISPVPVPRSFFPCSGPITGAFLSLFLSRSLLVPLLRSSPQANGITVIFSLRRREGRAAFPVFLLGTGQNRVTLPGSRDRVRRRERRLMRPRTGRKKSARAAFLPFGFAVRPSVEPKGSAAGEAPVARPPRTIRRRRRWFDPDRIAL